MDNIKRGVIKENALIDGFINAVTAIPPIAYLIVFVGAWGSGAKTTLIALTISYILRYIKLVRTRTDMEIGMLHTNCSISAGTILLDDVDVSMLSRKAHRELCGKRLGFIPQNPMTVFDSRVLKAR